MNRLPTATELTRRLVQIPSVNPMGSHHTESPFLETRVTDFLEDLYREAGIPFLRQPVLPLRDNILALVDPHKSLGRNGLLLLEAHQDTVPIIGMTIEPFSGELRDGRIYGRGSCDIKGGLATILSVALRLLREAPANMPTIIVASTINEENGFDGIQRLAQSWTDGEFPFVPRLPDAAIIAEPTELNVVVAHKGTVRWECSTLGIAGHSSSPEKGRNAIYSMSRVVAALQKYAGSLTQRDFEYPLLGRPTLSVGTIRGGVSVNTIPDRCTIEIDRRLLPDENADQARREVIDFIANETDMGEEISHAAPYLRSLGLANDQNTAFADHLLTAVKSIAADSKCIGVPFGTNAGTLAKAGVPSVVFGPGSIAQAHTADEWIAVDQLQAAEEILFRFCSGGL